MVEYVPHYATFNGKHNAIKSKCFIVLYLAGSYLPAKEIDVGTGERGRYYRWHKHGYLIRRVRAGIRMPYYIYALSLRGKRFVEQRIPPEKYEQYLKEIKEHQESIRSTNKFVNDWYLKHFK